MMLTSVCKEYWQIILCQAIVTGLGFGCLFTPGVSIVSQYFVKKRQFANGVAAAGSGFGGVIYPIVLHRLTPQIGFDWAVRVVAFITLFFGIVSTATLRSRHASGKMRSVLAPGFFKNTPLVLYSFGLFAIVIALYIPIVYISSYALTYHITSPNLAFYLVPILQAANIVGRMVPNFFADWTGPINMTIPAMIGAAIMVYAWIAIRSQAGLLAFAVIYGIFFGTIQALGGPCVASLTPDRSILGSSMGMSFAIGSFGVLIGTPVGGAILGKDNNFVAVQAFTGSICVLALFFYLASRISKAGLRWEKV
ncbi:MFS-type transporter dbaD [Pseudocercospora fuligena]|uniref:MFS-type transporter dbaD n=1 Tax=Pseudocercospora fuligena TaxID=685502 RepID=A0A8H6RIZ5_9PEZI|nr:MFS-type transporter dbaD [Pseudocercospora fuligena]